MLLWIHGHVCPDWQGPPALPADSETTDETLIYMCVPASLPAYIRMCMHVFLYRFVLWNACLVFLCDIIGKEWVTVDLVWTFRLCCMLVNWTKVWVDPMIFFSRFISTYVIRELGDRCCRYLKYFLSRECRSNCKNKFTFQVLIDFLLIFNCVNEHLFDILLKRIPS